MRRALLVLALASCGGVATAPAPREPQVTLNHAFAIVDADSYAAASASPYLRDVFAPTEARTTHADGESWSGFYLYGARTYVELFAPGGVGAEGQCGVGLGVEQPGGIAAIAARRPLETGTRTAEIDGVKRPWFRMAYTASPDDAPVSVWLMEYLPEYMAWRLGKPDHDPRDITRESYLSTKQQPGRLLADVTGIDVALPPPDATKLAAELAGYGWRVDGSVLHGPEGVTLCIVPGGRAGIVSLRFALTRAVARTEVPLGRSRLVVGPGAEAVWTLRAD